MYCIVNAQTKQETVRYDLAEEYFFKTALIMAKLYRKDGKWYLDTVDADYRGDLQALLERYS